MNGSANDGAAKEDDGAAKEKKSGPVCKVVDLEGEKPFTVCVGDFVRISDNESPDGQFIARVTGFEGEDNFTHDWFYRHVDTMLGRFKIDQDPLKEYVPLPDTLDNAGFTLNSKRIFFSIGDLWTTSSALAAISGTVRVARVRPGDPPPEEFAQPGGPPRPPKDIVQPGDPPRPPYDFWFDQSYTKIFMTFQDIPDDFMAASGVPLPPPIVRLPQASPAPLLPHDRQATKGPAPPCVQSSDTQHPGGLTHHAVPQLDGKDVDGEPHHPPEGGASPTEADTPKRVMLVQEVCCGAGGLAFMEQRVYPEPVQAAGQMKRLIGAEVKCQWAVDYNDDAALTYWVNHPKAKVYKMGLDEWYELVRKWQKLSDQYPDSWVDPSETDSDSGSGSHSELEGERALDPEASQLGDEEEGPAGGVRGEECRKQAAAGAMAGQDGDPGSASASASGSAPGSPGSPGSIAQGTSPAAHAREATAGAAVCSAAKHEGPPHAADVEVRSSRVRSPQAEVPANTSAVNPWALPSSESPPPPNSSPSPPSPPHPSDELSELINLSLSPARDVPGPSSPLQRYPVTQEQSPSHGRDFAANGADGRWSTEQMLLASVQTKVFAKLSPMDQITALVAGTEAEDVRGVQGSRGSELARDSGAEGSGLSDDEQDRSPSLPLSLSAAGEALADGADQTSADPSLPKGGSLSAAGEAHADGADCTSVDPSWREGDVYTSPQHMPAPAQPPPRTCSQDMPPPPAPSSCPGPSTASAGSVGNSGNSRRNPTRAGRPQPPGTREASTSGTAGGGNGLASSSAKNGQGAQEGNKKASPSAKTSNRATPVKRRKEEVEEEIGGWAELEDGTYGSYPADQRWDVEDILNIRLTVLNHVKRDKNGLLLKDLEDGDSQLEFLVNWAVDERGRRWQNSWQTEQDLSCPKHIAAFVKRWRKEGNIPLREHGKNMIFAGGPPCQGMSGMNKGAPVTDILSHPKNRLIKVFLKLFEWFQPTYTVTEQVVDSARKEDGIYLRFLIAKATSMRYQVRVHIREAGGDGCPQGRYRVIIFTARQGEQLPPVPEPSHEVAEFNTGICNVMESCYLYKNDMMEDGSEKWRPVLNQDAMSDLPKVSNFSLSSSCSYSSPPQCPFQVLCRCPPPPGTPSLEERVRMAEAYSPARLFAQAVVAFAEFGSTDGGPSPDGLYHVGLSAKNCQIREFKYGLGDDDSFHLGQDDSDFDEDQFFWECPDTAKGKKPNQHMQTFDKFVRSQPKNQWKRLYARRAQNQRGCFVFHGNLLYNAAKSLLAELANPSGTSAEVGRLPLATTSRLVGEAGQADNRHAAGFGHARSNHTARVGNAASSADVGSNLAAKAVNAAASGPASGSCPAGTFNRAGSEQPGPGPSAASNPADGLGGAFTSDHAAPGPAVTFTPAAASAPAAGLGCAAASDPTAASDASRPDHSRSDHSAVIPDSSTEQVTKDDTPYGRTALLAWTRGTSTGSKPAGQTQGGTSPLGEIKKGGNSHRPPKKEPKSPCRAREQAPSKVSSKAKADVESRPGVKSEAGGSNTHKLGFFKGNAPPTAPGVADDVEIVGEGLTHGLATAASGTLGMVDQQVSDLLVDPEASGAQPPLQERSEAKPAASSDSIINLVDSDSGSDVDMDCKPAAGFGGAAASDRIAAFDHTAPSGGDMDSARKSDSGSNRDALPASSSVEIVGVREGQDCAAEEVNMMDGVDATDGMGQSTIQMEASPSAGPRSAGASGVRSLVVAIDVSSDTISLPNMHHASQAAQGGTTAAATATDSAIPAAGAAGATGAGAAAAGATGGGAAAAVPGPSAAAAAAGHQSESPGGYEAPEEGTEGAQEHELVSELAACNPERSQQKKGKRRRKVNTNWSGNKNSKVKRAPAPGASAAPVVSPACTGLSIPVLQSAGQVTGSPGCTGLSTVQPHSAQSHDPVLPSADRCYGHRPYMLNADDYLRVSMVPKEPGASFRNFQGVVVNKTTRKACVGHFHAVGCDKTCGATTCWLSSGAVTVLKASVQFKKQKPSPRFMPFGRMRYDSILATMLGWTGPGSLAISHPDQDRIISFREGLRIQGFPDYFQLAIAGRNYLNGSQLVQLPPPGSRPPAPASPSVARAGSRPPSRKKLLEDLRKQFRGAQALFTKSQSSCFTMIGNAVSPLVARSIGRCFSLAAVKACPPDQNILTHQVLDPWMAQAYREAEQQNLRPFWEEVNRAKEEEAKVKKMKVASGVTFAVEEEEEEEGEEEDDEDEEETEEDRGFNGFSAGPALFANSNSADDEEAERQATRERVAQGPPRIGREKATHHHQQQDMALL